MSKDTLLATSLRILRETRSLSQKELAEISGIERNTISKYENGWIQPSREKLQAILEALRFSYAELDATEAFVRRLLSGSPPIGLAGEPPSGSREEQIRRTSEDLGRNLGTLLQLVVTPPEGKANGS